jgi:pantoate--beta-alanine ligase
MGYLHEGHLSLIREARRQCGLVVLSIFVNPLQFGPNEDLERYPRDLERDAALAEQAGVDLLFAPGVQEMYPKPTRTKVTVSDLTARLCGASRPGHFDGVTTVVMKLFQMVQPDLAFFGMKDAQQVAVVEQMVYDLNVPVRIVRCPTVREADGLAMSSRNVYLREDERRQAVVLSQVLYAAGEWLAQDPALTVGRLHERIAARIRQQPDARIDYVEILTYPALEPLQEQAPIARVSEDIIVALAVKFGSTRLIDNRIFTVEEVRSLVSHHDEV